MTHRGCTVWLTGLSGSGKSTLALALHRHLQKQGIVAEILDGDELRQWLTKDLTFTKQDRDENVRRIARLAQTVTDRGAIAIVAAISPYAAARAEARRILSRFLEVHVDCPLEVCRRRDPKGLYAKALRGQIPCFTGISDPYEPPEKPELRVRTDRLSPERCLELILDKLVVLQYIPEPAGHIDNPSRGRVLDR